MEREEIDAMWERIKALEKDSLNEAWKTAAFEVQFTYNWALTTLGFCKPAEIDAYINYMKPKSESAQDAALGASSAQEALEIAADFQNDYIAYLRSRK